jgi:NaMN:DMB phosphoribosyltransferase
MWTNSLLDGMISYVAVAVACALLYGFVYVCMHVDSEI